MYDWHNYLISYNYKRYSNYKGDYSKSWFYHNDDFVVGLLFDLNETSIEIRYRKKNKKDIFVQGIIKTPLDLELVLTFLSAINDKLQFPLHVNNPWGIKIISAYFNAEK